MTVELKHAIPITVKTADNKEKQITTNKLTFGRMKAKHMKLFPKGDLENLGEYYKENPYSTIPLIAALCDITEEAAGEIDLIDDLENVASALSEVLGNAQSPETGK